MCQVYTRIQTRQETNQIKLQLITYDEIKLRAYYRQIFIILYFTHNN